MRAAGALSMRTIAAELSDREMLTPRGAPLASGETLTNRAYRLEGRRERISAAGLPKRA